MAQPAAAVFESGELRAPLEDETSPVLYTHVLCPYAQRAWLALLEKGVECRVVNVDLSDKPGWFLRLNRAGLVPAVAHRGHVQTESLDICRWVDNSFAGPALRPPGQEAAVDSLLRDCSGFASAGLSLLAGSGRSWGIVSGHTQAQRQRFDAELQQLAAAIRSGGGPFLAGASPSLADVAYYPFAERFEVAMPEFCCCRPSDVLEVGAWLAAMGARESARTSSANRQRFLAALREHRSLDFFDFVSSRATALHPHLQRAAA